MQGIKRGDNMTPKIGRPPLSNPNSKNLTIRLNGELLKRLDEYCKRNNITKGEVVREGINAVIKKK